MSDVSVLSHEYKTTSELSQTLNSNLIVLKKEYWGLPGAENISVEQLETSRRRLAEILSAIISLLDPARARGMEVAYAARVPGALVARLRTERRGDLAYYLEDLEQLATRLREGSPRLTDPDFALLDHLASVADAEASGVFRQLMRI